MSEPDAAEGGAELFRGEALAHRYRKHWGCLPADAHGRGPAWLALAAGAAVAAAAIALIGGIAGLQVLLP